MTKAKLYSEIQSGLIHVASGDLSVEKCREVIESMVDQYALQIARKAVDQERNVPYAHEPERMYQAAVCNRILSRIKSELNSSGVNEDINTTETEGE